MKKEKKIEKMDLLKQKENLRNFIEYLVDLYYLNPKSNLCMYELKKELNIKECNILDEFILYLKQNHFIKIKKTKFTITYDGFVYLEALQKTNKEYENNLISVVVSISAFIISLFAFIWSDSTIVKILLTVFLFVFVFKILKFIDDIINKKYY